MRKKNAFTLMELTIVIAIIGLVAIGVFSSFIRSQQRSRDAKRRGDLKSLQNALEQCYSLDIEYPVVSFGSQLNCTGGATTMNSSPVDPKNSGSFPSGYIYSCVGTCDDDEYCYCAHLEVAGEGNSNASCSLGGSGDYFCIKNLQ